MLKNIDKMKKQRKQVAEAVPEEEPSQTDEAPSSPLEAPLSASEKDGIAQQVRRCWNMVPGLPLDSLGYIQVRVHFNPDGSIQGTPELLDRSRMSDPFYRSAAETAVRAVLACQPYRMPSEKYNTWKLIDFNFDPREMGT